MQRRNTSSLFWFMKRMINMRKKHKAFGRGDLTFLNVDNPKVLAFLRRYEDETLLICGKPVESLHRWPKYRWKAIKGLP